MEERELPSESEESDEDYVPSGEEGRGSEEESDGEVEDKLDEGETISKPRKRKGKSTKKKARKRARSKSPPPEPEKDVETPEQDEEQLKKKADDLWADFQKDALKPTKREDTSKSSTVSEKSSVSTKPVTETVTRIFEFAGEKVEIPIPSTFGGKKLCKSGSGMSYSAMLNKRKPTVPLSRVPVKVAAGPDKTPTVTSKVTAVPSSTPAVPSKAPSVPSSTPAVPSSTHGAPFPGLKNSGSGIPSRVGGLGSLLGQLGKKNKLSTLEKSKLDWEGYKEQNGLTEEIQTHNKGKHGFLEKQDFLQRTDLRQFELEKQMRSTTRRSNR